MEMITYEHNYDSDISREEYELIRQDLENAKKRTKPLTYDLYDIFCAILYLVKGGIQWRLLPQNFPKWQNVYYHFQIWTKKGEDGVSVFDKVLSKLVTEVRNEDGRCDKTTLGIVDAQSVQNASPAEEKGYDAGKNFRNKAPRSCRYHGTPPRNLCHYCKCN